MKFRQNYIESNGKRFKVISYSKRENGDIRVLVDEFFAQEELPKFGSDSDLMTDYFERITREFKPEEPEYKEVLEQYKKAQEKNEKLRKKREEKRNAMRMREPKEGEVKILGRIYKVVKESEWTQGAKNKFARLVLEMESARPSKPRACYKVVKPSGEVFYTKPFKLA